MLAFGRLVKVHSLDVRSLYGPSHRSACTGVNGAYAPRFAVVFHEVGARERGFLGDDENICRGIFASSEGQLDTNHVGAESGDAGNVGGGITRCMLSVSQLNLVNSPEHLFFFKHIAYNELLIGINNQDHSRGLGSIGEDEGNVGWRWWSKHNGVYVLAFLAPYFEVCTVPDLLLMKNLVSGHGFARRTIRGVVEDFLFFPPIVVFHGAPSFDALNPLGLNPPTWSPCKA